MRLWLEQVVCGIVFLGVHCSVVECHILLLQLRFIFQLPTILYIYTTVSEIPEIFLSSELLFENTVWNSLPWTSPLSNVHSELGYSAGVNHELSCRVWYRGLTTCPPVCRSNFWQIYYNLVCKLYNMETRLYLSYDIY